MDEYDEYGYRYQEYENQEPIEFQPERNVYERVNIGTGEEGTEGIQTLFGKNMAEVFRELRRRGYSDDERFKLVINIARSKLSSYLSVSLKDIENIKEFTLQNSLDKINYLNPNCLILGYYITNGGKTTINKEKFNQVIKVLPKIEDVTPPDLIRYCRFWNKSV